MKSPFKFLDAYTLRDRDAFFGREQETSALYEMSFRSPLILLFGLSGTGKTSLVQCGLASRFDGPEWYPFFIRRQDNINDSMKAALSEALDGYPQSGSLPGMARELFEEYLSPVYLIFDQFEELFILGTPEEQEEFADSLRALLGSGLPCKVILAMREEYLGRLYHFEKAIPYLFDFRLRVEPMSNMRIKEVLRSSFQKFTIALEPPAEERLEEIIENLSGEKAGIPLPYLQVYLDMLWKQVCRETFGENPTHKEGEYPALTFTQEAIAKLGRIENVLERFLQQQKTELEAELHRSFPALPDNFVQNVLDLFVSAEGTKRPLSFKRLDNGEIRLEEGAAGLSGEWPLAAVSFCLEFLERRSLLRFEEGAMELAHDSLADLIDKQRTDEQRLLNEQRLRIAAAYREWHHTGEFMTRRQLASVEDSLPKLALEENLREFVEQSRQEADRRERKAIEEAERKFREEKKLRDAAEENERKARFHAGIAGVLALAALALAAWALSTSYSLKAANRTIADEYLSEVDSVHFYHLQYEQALEPLRAAARLSARQKEVAQRVQELAFFFNESGDTALAAEVLSEFKDLPGVGASFPGQPGQEGLREAIRLINTVHFERLEKRYFPEMMPVPGGEFVMGCDPRLVDCPDTNATPAHRVQLPAFHLSRTEATNWQYGLFRKSAGLNPPAGVTDGDNPATGINWYDAAQYINWLNKHFEKDTVYTFVEAINEVDWRVEIRKDAEGSYRLPTEAEWEFAARGGPEQEGYLYSGGSRLDSVGWYNNNAGSDPQPVAALAPNILGLYDMSGNAWEWCQDWYDPDYYDASPVSSPSGPGRADIPGTPHKVLRGGCWAFMADYCRVDDRSHSEPGLRTFNFTGFRVALR